MFCSSYNCGGHVGNHGYMSCFVCSTGRKTVTVDDLLQPDAPFVQREIRVSIPETRPVMYQVNNGDCALRHNSILRPPSSLHVLLNKN